MSGTLLLMESLVRLGAEDAGEVLTLQRAAYVTEAQAHADLNLPPLRQSLTEVAAELADPEVLALGWRNPSGRLVAAVRARVTTDDSWVAEIGRLTVVPDQQGQRLGTRLLAAVEAQLPDTVAVVYGRAQRRQPAPLRPARLPGEPSTAHTGRLPTRPPHQGPPGVRLTIGQWDMVPVSDPLRWLRAIPA